MGTNQTTDTTATPIATDTCEGYEPHTLNTAFRALWDIRPGKRNRTGKRMVRTRITARVGQPDIQVTQRTYRDWTVTITAPADWQERFGHNPFTEHNGRQALILDIEPARDGLRLWWLAWRPSETRNVWTVLGVYGPT